MTLVLARIDDRLIHGQVALGCCPALDARRLLLCCDEVAADPLERAIYMAAAPAGVSVEVLGRQAARERLRSLQSGGDTTPTILIAPAPADLLALVRDGAPIAEVNLGGLHSRAGARETWPGVYLLPHERDDLIALLRAGVRVVVQSVPSTAAHVVSLAELESSGPTPADSTAKAGGTPAAPLPENRP